MVCPEWHGALMVCPEWHGVFMVCSELNEKTKLNEMHEYWSVWTHVRYRVRIGHDDDFMNPLW